MKKSCYGCVAKDDSITFTCSLKYKILVVPDPLIKGRFSQIPAEKCPKPKTIKKFFELQKNEVL